MSKYVCEACNVNGRALRVRAEESEARVVELETALRGLVEYTDDMVAGDGMPDSPEQIVARKALASDSVGEDVDRGGVNDSAQMVESADRDIKPSKFAQLVEHAADPGVSVLASAEPYVGKTSGGRTHKAEEATPVREAVAVETTTPARGPEEAVAFLSTTGDAGTPPEILASYGEKVVFQTEPQRPRQAPSETGRPCRVCGKSVAFEEAVFCSMACWRARERRGKPDCENCGGTGKWDDIVWDAERNCPCINGEAMKAQRPSEARPSRCPYEVRPVAQAGEAPYPWRACLFQAGHHGDCCSLSSGASAVEWRPRANEARPKCAQCGSQEPPKTLAGDCFDAYACKARRRSNSADEDEFQKDVAKYRTPEACSLCSGTGTIDADTLSVHCPKCRPCVPRTPEARPIKVGDRVTIGREVSREWRGRSGVVVENRESESRVWILGHVAPWFFDKDLTLWLAHEPAQRTDNPESNRASVEQATIQRYQRAFGRLWDMFPSDPLGDHPAHFIIERFEALLDLGLIGPTCPAKATFDDAGVRRVVEWLRSLGHMAQDPMRIADEIEATSLAPESGSAEPVQGSVPTSEVDRLRGEIAFFEGALRALTKAIDLGELTTLSEAQHCVDSMLGERAMVPRSETAPTDDRTAAALEVAIAFAEEGWSYATDYFREKWNFDKRSKELRAIANVTEDEPLPTSWAESVLEKTIAERDGNG